MKDLINSKLGVSLGLLASIYTVDAKNKFLYRYFKDGLKTFTPMCIFYVPNFNVFGADTLTFPILNSSASKEGKQQCTRREGSDGIQVRS